MRRINQLKIGAFLSYLQMFLNIAISIGYTPFMLRTLGQSEYGLYSTISSTLAMLTVLNFGFNSSYIRYYSGYKDSKNETAIAKLNGMYLIIFSFIGFVSLICGFVLTFNLECVFSEGLKADEYQTAKKLMILLSVNMAVSFPMSVFTNIISAHEKYLFLKSLGIIKTVFTPILTIPLLIIGFGSFSLVLTTMVLAFATDIVYLVYSKKKLNVQFKFYDFPKGLFRELFVFSAFVAINLIVDQINNNLDKFLLGRYKGTESVAVYSVGFSLYHYYMLFSTAISSVCTPRIHRIINQTRDNQEVQKEELTAFFTKVGRIQYVLLALFASGMVFFGKPFIMLWAGMEYGESYYVAILLVIPSTIALIQNLGIEVQRALNKHQFRSIVYMVMALINACLTIFLCQRYGAIGAAIGTAISLIIANGLIMNIYYQRECNIDVCEFWKNILRLSIGLIIPVLAGIVISINCEMKSVGKLLIGIFVYVLIYGVSMWFFGINQYEKNLIRTPIRRVMNK